jgi:hypothetical protein
MEMACLIFKYLLELLILLLEVINPLACVKQMKEMNMKKKLLGIAGMFAALLALGLALAGCDDGSTNDDSGGGNGDLNATDLYGNWKATDPRGYDCYVTITASGWTLSMTNGFSDYGTYTIAGSTAKMTSSIYKREIGAAAINDTSSIIVTTYALPASSSGPGYIASTVVLYRQ